MLEGATPDTERLKEYGFKPGVVISSTEPMFKLDDLKAALFQSTYSAPKTVKVNLGEACTALVTLDMVQAIWLEHEGPNYPAPHGGTVYHENPDWYAEGWLQIRSQRVRMYVISGGIESVDALYVQIITGSPRTDEVIYNLCVD